MHIRAQISAELRKLDTLWVRSKRADPQRLSDNNASVTLTSNHEGHATGQRNNASASGDRSGGTGVRQGGAAPPWAPDEAGAFVLRMPPRAETGAGPLPVEIWPRVVTPVVPTGPEAAPARP